MSVNPTAMEAGHHEKAPHASHVVPTKLWLLIVRALQLAIAITVFAIACSIVSTRAESVSFALFCGIFTAVVVLLYILGTSLVRSAQVLYHVFAVIALDALATIFWLSAMGSVAALANDEYFDYYTDNREGRVIAIAILSAFEFLLFLLTLIYTIIAARKLNLLTLRHGPAAATHHHHHGATTAAPVGGAPAPPPGNYEMASQPAHSPHAHHAVPGHQQQPYQPSTTPTPYPTGNPAVHMP